MTQPLNRIVQYIRQQEYLIQGIFEKKLYQIPLNEVLYFETVDKKTFMYTQQKIFECKKTLSAIEQDLIRSNVVRISKTALLNISCLVCVKPYPNHRLLAELNNEENLIVSRKYIPILRDKIRSGYYVYLMVSVIVDWLLSFIDFSKYIYHFIAEMIILYPITIGVAFIGKWFAFSAINITWYSCVYILIMIAIHCYFYHISKRQADEINNFLKLRGNSNGRYDKIL